MYANCRKVRTNAHELHLEIIQFGMSVLGEPSSFADADAFFWRRSWRCLNSNLRQKCLLASAIRDC